MRQNASASDHAVSPGLPAASRTARVQVALIANSSAPMSTSRPRNACALRGGELVRPETVLRGDELRAWLPSGAVVLGPGARAIGVVVPEEPRAPAAWAIAELCAPALRGADYEESACFALAPNYLQPSSAEVALREGRVGKLP